MTRLIKETPNNIQILEYLSDSARLLCHMHYEISKNRRNILASGLNKDVKDLMDDSLIEGLLLGNDFTEKIKASQAAKKLSSQSLKPTLPNKVPKDKPKHNLNYKGPLRSPAAARQSGQKGNFLRHQPKSSAHQQRPTSKKHPPQRRH
ncbi:uncharacterized protein isoform X1 [Choristoneura fumiferana]|uniref:uncharacterized protein isoform X1 n=1 Tax=Choristoneura fumiferana TaxID=7141 RepID=UPI003D158F7A